MVTVLIVDDNEMLRTYAARNLQSDLPGVRVVTAGSCDEARRRAEADPPRVVVLDQRLSDGLGTDLLGDLTKRSPGLRVIMATGETGSGFRDRALSTGAFEALMKPYDIDQLVAAVKRALPKQVCDAEGPPIEGGAPGGPAPALRVRSENRLGHRALNRLSALLAGLRACEADLRDEASDEAEVLRIVERYFPRLREAVADVSLILHRMANEDGDFD